MKIQITGSSQDRNLSLPTKLVFSKFVLHMVWKNRNANADSPKLSPEAVDKLSEELQRIKRKYGTWTLVEVNSHDGENVTVIL